MLFFKAQINLSVTTDFPSLYVEQIIKIKIKSFPFCDFNYYKISCLYLPIFSFVCD